MKLENVWKTTTAMLGAAGLLAIAAGCQSSTLRTVPPAAATNGAARAGAPAADVSGNESTNSTQSLLLHDGDTLKISFPGAPNLDTIETIRVDGKITLQMIGEYEAAGKTPAAVETDLRRLYGSQLVNNEVSVTVQSSVFVIYVMGAVTKPGELQSDRPLSPLQALIEAGVDDTKANLKAVQIIRTDSEGHTQKFILNLHKVLHSSNEQMPNFTLKPYDVINVPEKFNFY